MSIADQVKLRELEARVKSLEDALAARAPVSLQKTYDDYVAAYEARFGHPPHHRMKLETIKAQLEQ